MQALDERIPYECTRCHHVTYAPTGRVAVTCGNCGIIDLGTELARRQWATVAEIRMANTPDPAPAAPRRNRQIGTALLAIGLAAAVFVLAAILAEAVLP